VCIFDKGNNDSIEIMILNIIFIVCLLPILAPFERDSIFLISSIFYKPFRLNPLLEWRRLSEL
jgi:hypothetical protein